MVMHIVVCRKPILNSMVDNVFEYGSGGLNIDASRIDFVTIDGGNLSLNTHLRKNVAGGCGGRIIATEEDRRFYEPPRGRYPVNVIFDQKMASLLDEQSGDRPGMSGGGGGAKDTTRKIAG